LPRIWLTYDPQAGPTVEVLCRARLSDGSWGPMHTIEAVVDSGATRSFIRSADLGAMGLDATEVTDRPPGRTVKDAMGHSHPAEHVNALIVAKLATPDRPNGWGPMFRWTPDEHRLGVKAGGDRLLGTRDFFQWFEVSFWHSDDQPRLSIAY